MFSEEVKKLNQQIIEKEKEKERAFRECVWKNTQENFKILYDSVEEKERYLDKECEKLEKEYLENINQFIKSLQVFSDFDVYKVQEAFDKICFFFSQNRKKLLETCLCLSMMNPEKMHI